jgi:proline iminopeptidase
MILIGHSYGGFLATLYALEFPEHVEKMILIAPAGVLKMPVEEGEGFDKIKDYLSEKQKTAFEDFLSRYFDYGKIFTKSEKELGHLNSEYIAHFGTAMEALGMKLPAREKPDLALAGGWMVHALYLSLGMKYDLREELKKIPVPVLVLHGERDMMPVKPSQEYADLLPAGKIRIISKASHFPFTETPGEFSLLARSFLKEK